MRETTREELERIERLKPGTGALNAYLFGRGTLDSGAIGGGLDYSHRVNESLSAFAKAEAGYSYGDEREAFYEGLAGLRLRF